MTLPGRTRTRYVLAALAVAAVASALICAAFPVYFRTDDLAYMSWASSADGVADAFMPSRATLFGMFRPVQNVVWLAMFRAFGLQPFGYQFLLTFLYFTAIVFFGVLLLEMRGFLFAAVGLALWLGVFQRLQYIIFWFSDFTYVLQLALMVPAILLFRRGISGSSASLAASFIFYVLACMAKEPAAVIVPAVGIGLLVDRRRSGASAASRGPIVTLSAMVLFGTVWLLAFSGLASRQTTAAGTVPFFPDFVMERWRFYSAHVCAGTGFMVPAAALLTAVDAVWRPARRTGTGRIALITVVLAAAFLAARYPSAALAVAAAVLGASALCGAGTMAGAAWFLLPLFGITTIAFMVRTYLVEAAMGAAVVMAWAFHDDARTVVCHLRARLPRWSLLAAPAVAAGLAVATVGAVPALRERLDALRTVSAVRTNTADAIRHAADTIGSFPVVLIDYKAMGLDYVKDVMPLPDVRKAHIQNPMDAVSLKALLTLSGVKEPRVEPFSAFIEGETDTALLLTANKLEQDFVTSRDDITVEKQAEFRSGSESAAVFLCRRL